MTNPDALNGVVERVSNALAGTDADARFRCDFEWVCADDLRHLLRCAEAVEKVTRKLTDIEFAFKMSQTHNGKLMGRAIRAERERDVLHERLAANSGWAENEDRAALIAAVRAEERARARQVANDVVESHEYSEQDCWRHGYPSKQSERMAERFTDGLRAGVARVLAALTDGGAA